MTIGLSLRPDLLLRHLVNPAVSALCGTNVDLEVSLKPGPELLLSLLALILGTAVFLAGLFLSGGYIAERLEKHDMRRMGRVAGLSPLAAAEFGTGADALAGLPPTGATLARAAPTRG